MCDVDVTQVPDPKHQVVFWSWERGQTMIANRFALVLCQPPLERKHRKQKNWPNQPILRLYKKSRKRSSKLVSDLKLDINSKKSGVRLCLTDRQSSCTTLALIPLLLYLTNIYLPSYLRLITVHIGHSNTNTIRLVRSFEIGCAGPARQVPSERTRRMTEARQGRTYHQ